MPLAQYENGMENRSLSHRQRRELYYCMMKSTVVIDCKIIKEVTDENGNKREVIDKRRGGGVILNEQGLILTSLKLVHEVSSISVKLSDMATTHEATIVFDNVNLDLALIQISELVISIGSLCQLPPFHCSYSYADELVTVGTKNVLNEEVHWRAYYFPGMMYMIGSPVYDSSGNIVALQQGYRSHYAMALPGEKLLEFYSAYFKSQEDGG